jgi:hypothetical protein
VVCRNKHSLCSPSGSIGTVLIGKVGGGCQWQGGVNNIVILPSVYTVSSRIKATNYGLVSGNFSILDNITVGHKQVKVVNLAQICEILIMVTI